MVESLSLFLSGRSGRVILLRIRSDQGRVNAAHQCQAEFPLVPAVDICFGHVEWEPPHTVSYSSIGVDDDDASYSIAPSLFPTCSIVSHRDGAVAHVPMKTPYICAHVSRTAPPYPSIDPHARAAHAGQLNVDGAAAPAPRVNRNRKRATSLRGPRSQPKVSRHK